MFKQLLYLVVSVSLYETNASKVLFVSPLPSKSHSILGHALVEHLVNAGHHVSYITVFVPERPPPNVTVVDISDNIKNFPSDELDMTAIMDKTVEMGSFLSYVPMLLNMSKVTLEHPNIQKLLADKDQQFDVVIAEWMFTEVYAGFAGVFNCPLIWFSTVEPHWMVLRLIDELPNPAYSIDTFSDSVLPLTFQQRVIELGLMIMGRLVQTLLISSPEIEQYNEYFVPAIRERQLSVPTLESLKYNGTLILSNSHVSMGTPVRLPPNFISIGGYHIKSNVKPLPQELQNLMDKARHGVIYFSMGSNLNSKHFPDEVKQELLTLFGKLKQTVLWKFEEDLPNKPSNVHILKWAPQQSILHHKNCVLFITHGGLLSITESIHFGVPIIGIPVFADQFVNVARSVKKGYAQKVDLSYTIAADLEVAIAEILGNPKYTDKVKTLSQVYHDRVVPPEKELVHWVEHVVKTKGALHLRSPAFLVPWYQKLYIDLIVVILVTCLILKYFFVYVKGLLITNKKEKLN